MIRESEPSSAITDWEARQHSLLPPQYSSLQARINPDLVALRGIQRTSAKLELFAGRMCAYAIGLKPPHEQEAGNFIKVAAAILNNQSRNNELDTALIQADDLIRRNAIREELAALGDADDARKFIKEVLADSPKSSITSTNLSEMLAFDESVRPPEDRIVLCAKLIYLRVGSGLTPEGTYDWLHEPSTDFAGQTPLDIINHGSGEQNNELFLWTEARRP
jgi:hypothetical protein